MVICYVMCWEAVTHRIALHDFAFHIANDHHQLRLESDDEDGTLFHHFPHRQLEPERHVSDKHASDKYYTSFLHITYINIVNVKYFGVELETHGFGLLDGVSELTVRLKPREHVDKSVNMLFPHKRQI